MLTTIQEMRYFLRTAYGDSTRCANSTVEVKYQGLCQGNGAAPAGWAAISITILMAHKADGHGATFVCPFTPSKQIDLAAILFVDDTDIIHINMKKRETINEVHAALTASVRSWNNLLMATGGTLHPDKCFYYLMSYYYDERKQCWLYEDHTKDCYYDIELSRILALKNQCDLGSNKGCSLDGNNHTAILPLLIYQRVGAPNNAFLNPNLPRWPSPVRR